MSTPAAFYNNAVDLNRYSNKVARQIVTTYNDVIVSAVDQLRGLDDQTAPIRATRLRAILGQLKGSLDGWAGDATALAVGELQGLAELQGEFVQEQLQELMDDVLDPENLDLAIQIRNVQISPNFAQSVAVTDPTAINVVTLSDDLQQAVRGNFQASFRLDAAKGATITLPNGKVLEKSFRGIATSNTEIFARNVRVGLLEGQSIERISRGLRGRVRFGQRGSVAQIQRMGGDATKMANHQLLTLVRTSVNQVANATAQANYQANQEVTKKYKYVATLDGRTSPICRSLDGKEFAYNDGPTPPQHFNCRSTTVPIIDYKGLGVNQPPPDRRKARNAKNGLIPGDQTYGDWLAGQSKKTKAEILGSERRAEIFDSFTKKVGPKEAIRKFVRDDGSELDLGDLERRLKRTKAKPVAPVTPKPKPKPKPKKTVAPPKQEIRQWTANGYKEMRAEEFRQAQAAGVKLNKYEKEQIKKFPRNDRTVKATKAMEAYVKSDAARYKGTVYRGMNLEKAELDDLLKRYESGGPALAMESWTKNPDLSDFTIGGGNPVKLKIVNKHGVDIERFSGIKEEREVLMPKNVRYRVKSVERTEFSASATKRGIYNYNIELEQLDD